MGLDSCVHRQVSRYITGVHYSFTRDSAVDILQLYRTRRWHYVCLHAFFPGTRQEIPCSTPALE